MRRAVGLSLGLVVAVVVGACSGSVGPAGTPGTPGTPGSPGSPGAPGAPGNPGTADGGAGTASISAITPPRAFTGRTVDLTIAGSGSAWDSATTVTFANAKVKVNKVTVASVSGLLVNVTIADDATLGATDVTVTDKMSTAVYKGAFEIDGPIAVTVTPSAGVPQGGLADVNVVMSDLTTPFDPNTTTLAVSSTDIAVGTPSPTDYAFDVAVQADVLATVGTFDVTVMSGVTPVTSLAPQTLKIAARTPTTLTAGATGVSGMINTELDTELYEFTPASASQEFVQFTVSSMAGQVSGTAIPKSGKYADALSGFGIRYGEGITSTDPLYLVVGDSNSAFGAGPVPADSLLVAFESPCTAATETAETAAANNDAPMTAQVVSTLPALVSGTLGYGSVDPTLDIDTYEITVAAGVTSLHVATGGDPADDSLITIVDVGGNVLATSDDMDFQEDLVFPIPSAGSYYIQVSGSMSGSFTTTDNTYQLFIQTK